MLVARSIPNKEEKNTHISRYNRIKVWHICFWVNIVQIPCKIFTLKAVPYFKSFWEITKWFLEKDDKWREGLIKTALVKHSKCYYLYLSLGIKNISGLNRRRNLTALVVHSGSYACLLISGFKENQVALWCRQSVVLFLLCTTNLPQGTKISSKVIWAKKW